MRVEAKVTREAFIAALPYPILKEINRRRVAKGKPRVIKHVVGPKRPLNAYMRCVLYSAPYTRMRKKLTLRQLHAVL